MTSPYKIWPGSPFPLGAHWDGKGVNFAIFSEHAEQIQLCLFDPTQKEREIARIDMPENDNMIWHVYLPEAKPGLMYGYRVFGPYDPSQGKRYNPAKLLLDPYATAITGKIHWDDALFGYAVGSPEEDLSKDERDSAPFIPKSIVIDPHYHWGDDRPPNTPFHQTIIYETHVKGFTARHPDVPEKLRGTYAGMAHPSVVDYLRSLSITAVELMPIQQFVADRSLVERGLTNYWGYNTIGFFAPDVRYSSSGVMGQQVVEFKDMVKTLHQAGIEVYLDVVYNHTAEGNQMGPTLSFRGIDNEDYYRLAEDCRYYTDYTGTGNTLNMTQPAVLRLLMDSLRYWIQDMHVDGFRFDLAATLARELHDVDRLGSFFDIINQDPIISQVKLIAEPWDLGEGGYQVGGFPPGWAEWNGKYRDAMRDYWRDGHCTLGEFSSRFTGSPDLYSLSGRKPIASINFITAHDGFTLNDLVSYNEKHNEANGENNQDGENYNRSWNCGVEGPTDNPDVIALRNRMKRNFLATLFFSQGVPMLLAGDEFGRTQQGNNNAYCQDNEISWIDWEHIDNDLLEFTRHVICMMLDHPVFRQRKWFLGRPFFGSGTSDIAWFTPEGKEMTEDEWTTTDIKTFGVCLNGAGIRSTDYHGNRVTDQSFYLMFNSYPDALEFTLPDQKWGTRWLKVLDTHDPVPAEEAGEYQPGDSLQLKEHTLVVLRHHDS